MNDAPCPREPDVLRAVEHGEWTADLRSHADGCEACREVRAVAGLLREAVDAEAATPLPEAGDVWWRAEWRARREARARALRPLDAIERSEPLVALVAVAVLLMARGDLVLQTLARWMSFDGGGAALAAVLPAAVMPFVLVGLALGGVVIVVGLGAVVARD